MRRAFVSMFLAVFSFPMLGVSGPATAAKANAIPPIAPRVLVVVAFADNGSAPPSEEAAPWVTREGIGERMATPSKTSLRCNHERTACLLISGVGKLNAATSLLALGFDPDVHLRTTYVLVSGIAGVSPETGTIGTPAWAHWIVDFDLAHEIDGREIPTTFRDSRFRQGCVSSEFCKSGWTEGTEVFALDPKTVAFAYGLTKDVKLDDPPLAARIRKNFSQAAARAAPHVQMCDIVAGDTYWVGTKLSNFSARWTKFWTRGAGSYCMSAMEDSAFAGSIRKLAALGRVDRHRFLDLRTGSDFDRQHAGQTALGALAAGIGDGTFAIAANNGYLTARVVERYIVAHWAVMERGIPRS